MSLWTVEVLRLTRTGRLVALVAVFLLFGLTSPVMTAYMEEILARFGDSLGGATIIVPPPSVAGALASYEGNAWQIGSLVLVVLAASAANVDAVPQFGVFLRVRVPSPWRILLPRVVVTGAAGALAALVGLVAAAYETWALIDPVGADILLTAVAAQTVFVAFVVALAAAWTQALGRTLPAIVAATTTLIVLALVAALPALSRYTPTSLTGAASQVAAGEDSIWFLPTVLVTATLTALLVAVAVLLFGRRELS